MIFIFLSLSLFSIHRATTATSTTTTASTPPLRNELVDLLGVQPGKGVLRARPFQRKLRLDKRLHLGRLEPFEGVVLVVEHKHPLPASRGLAAAALAASRATLPASAASSLAAAAAASAAESGLSSRE